MEGCMSTGVQENQVDVGLIDVQRSSRPIPTIATVWDAESKADGEVYVTSGIGLAVW